MCVTQRIYSLTKAIIKKQDNEHNSRQKVSDSQTHKERSENKFHWLIFFAYKYCLETLRVLYFVQSHKLQIDPILTTRISNQNGPNILKPHILTILPKRLLSATSQWLWLHLRYVFDASLDDQEKNCISWPS